MTSQSTSTHQDKPSTHQDKPCAYCDLTALDELKCESAGITEQAELTKASATGLEERRRKYDAARREYNQARGEVAPEVKNHRAQLEQLIEQFKCLLKQGDDLRMEQAHQNVKEMIDEYCSGAGPCDLPSDCDFDAPVPNDLPGLYARRAEVTRDTERAETAFDDLIKEPETLRTRVSKSKDELASITTAMAGDQQSIDHRRLYARLRVARQSLDDVWRGFDTTNAYMECLSRGLTYSLKGRKSLAVIGGRIRKLECQITAEAERCTWLRDNIVEEVLAEYERLGRSGQEAAEESSN